MAKKQVTFADIAEYTHFSKTTISRYFNHGPILLRLKIKERISQALDTLGYKKINLQKFWQMVKVSLSELLFQISTCITTLKC